MSKAHLQYSRIFKTICLCLALIIPNVCSRHIIRMGYIDKAGKVVIKPLFDFAGDFSEGLASVRIGNHRGYIDKTGKMVIEPIYDKAESFSEGLAAVRTSNISKYGYIDKTGKMVIEPIFDEAQGFSEGLAAVRIKSEHTVGYIDKTGRVMLRVAEGDAANSISEIHSFINGCALIKHSVYIGYWYNPKTGEKIVNAYDYYCEFISKTGNRIIGDTFDAASSFSEGLAAVRIKKKAVEYGYINTTGKMVIEPISDYARGFSEGLAAICRISHQIHQRGLAPHKWGYIDTTGKVVIEPIFDQAGDFSEGLAAECITKKNKYGYIDKTGKIAIKPNFDYARKFSEGLAAFTVGSKYYISD